MDYTPVADLSPGVRGARVKCRVARIWDCTNPMLDNQLLSTDFLFLDDKGYAIQASSRAKEAQWLRDSIEEGNIYLCGGFIVITSTNNYRACQNPDMIFVAKGKTTFQLCSEENSAAFPMNTFDLTPYNTLLNQASKIRYLSDVIGHLTSMSPIEDFYIKGKPVEKRVLELENTEGDTISVTLWSSVAHQINDVHVHQLLQQGSVIIILAAVYRSLASKSPTRVYINLPDPVTTNFRLGLNKPANFTMKSPMLPREQQMTANRKLVADLLHLNPHTNRGIRFTCSVMIKDINPFDDCWFPACLKCKTKVRTDNNVNWCDKCYAYTDDTPTHWYKLELSVEDDIGDCIFMLLGKHAERLIGHSAADLASNNNDKLMLPHPIKQLLHTSRIFEVEIMRKPSSTNSHNSLTSFKVTQTFEQPNSVSTKRAKTQVTASTSSTTNPIPACVT